MSIKDLQLLYSTNTQMKYWLHRDYFGNLHYAWCSPIFDARTTGKYSVGAGMPPSSDPASIYRELFEATIKRPDDHCAKVMEQKAKLKSLAVKFAVAGTITDAARDEVLAIVDAANIQEWRPLIYVIPVTDLLRPRISEVPRARRASSEMEYIVENLKLEEFHVIEFPS